MEHKHAYIGTFAGLALLAAVIFASGYRLGMDRVREANVYAQVEHNCTEAARLLTNALSASEDGRDGNLYARRINQCIRGRAAAYISGQSQELR